MTSYTAISAQTYLDAIVQPVGDGEAKIAKFGYPVEMDAESRRGYGYHPVSGLRDERGPYRLAVKADRVYVIDSAGGIAIHIGTDAFGRIYSFDDTPLAPRWQRAIGQLYARA